MYQDVLNLLLKSGKSRLKTSKKSAELASWDLGNLDYIIDQFASIRSKGTTFAIIKSSTKSKKSFLEKQT